MPVYEYACGKCDHEFEVEQRISDDPVKTCPKCRSRKVKKLISRTSFVLKGGGWYSDLYASKKEAAKAEKADGEPKGGDADKPAKAEPAKSDGKAKPKAKPQAEAKGKSKAA